MILANSSDTAWLGDYFENAQSYLVISIFGFSFFTQFFFSSPCLTRCFQCKLMKKSVCHFRPTNSYQFLIIGITRAQKLPIPMWSMANAVVSRVQWMLCILKMNPLCEREKDGKLQRIVIFFCSIFGFVFRYVYMYKCNVLCRCYETICNVLWAVARKTITYAQVRMFVLISVCRKYSKHFRYILNRSTTMKFQMKNKISSEINR